MGKSRLVREAMCWDAASALSWYTAQARLDSTDRPYALLADLLARAWGIEGKRADDVAAAVKTVCARIMPEATDAPAVLARLFGLVPPELSGMDPGAWRGRLRELVLLLLTRLAHEAPIVVCVEDAHWADESSIALLRHMARENHAQTVPVLLACTVRPTTALFTEEGRIALGDSYTEIALEPLSEQDVFELAGSLLSEGSSIDSLAYEMAAQSGGSPFKLEEYLRAAVESGRLAPSARGWALNPDDERSLGELTVDDVVSERIRFLGDETRQVLGEAAIVGRSFNYDLLRDITGAPDTLNGSMENLMTAGLLEADEEAPGRRYSFKHELIQQAAYESLDEGHRSELHNRLAVVLETEYADDAPMISERLAFHYQRGLSLEKALQYLLLAAGKGFDQFAFEESQRDYEKAYELAVAALDDRPEHRALLLDVLNGWAMLHADRGEHNEIWHLLEPHLALAESVDDPQRLVMFYVSLAAAESGRGQFVNALGYSERAAALAQLTGLPHLIAAAENEMAWSLLELGDFEGVVRHAWAGHKASEAAAHDHPRYWAIRHLRWTTLNVAGLAHLFQGAVVAADGLAAHIEAVDVGESDVRRTVVAAQCRGYSRHAAGDFAGAAAAYSAAGKSASDPGWAAAAGLYRSIALVDEGREADAEMLLRPMWEQSRGRYLRIEYFVQMHLGYCVAARGDVHQGIAMIHEATAELELRDCISQLAIAEYLLGKAHGLVVGGARDADGGLSACAEGPRTSNGADSELQARQWLARSAQRAEEIGAHGLACQVYLESSHLCLLVGKTAEARSWAARALGNAQKRDADEYARRAQELMDQLAG